MSRVIRAGGRPWRFSPIILGLYVVVVLFPASTATLYIWEQSGANVVGEPVKATGEGRVVSCEHDGLLYLRRWYSCAVQVEAPSKLPPVVEVSPPDLTPADIGRVVHVQERAGRGKPIFTTDRNRPFELIGFVGSIAILVGAVAGFGFLARTLRHRDR